MTSSAAFEVTPCRQSACALSQSDINQTKLARSHTWYGRTFVKEQRINASQIWIYRLLVRSTGPSRKVQVIHARQHCRRYRRNQGRSAVQSVATTQTCRLNSSIRLRVLGRSRLGAQQAKQQSPARNNRTEPECGGQLPLDVRPRDQMRLKDFPSSSANRLAKIGAVKLGSSSLIER